MHLESPSRRTDEIPTEGSVKNCKDSLAAEEKVVEWYAAEDMLYWDLFEGRVVKRPTASRLARELGISRQTIYNWAKTIPDFEARKKKAKEALVFQNSTAVWNMIFLKACAGDVKAAEMYLNAFDADYVSPKHKRPQPTSSQNLADLLILARQRKAESNTNSVQ